MIDPDRVIRDALNDPSLAVYHGFFSAITWLGSAGLWLAILVVCIVLDRWREIACILFIAIAFSTIINEDIKGVVQRIRPGDVIVAGYYVHKSYSFPSGHTQTAFAIATILSAFLERRYNVITYLLAAAVGLSRIYLGVHYFTDVIAGAAIGIILGVLAIYGVYRLGLYSGNGIPGIVPHREKKGTVARSLVVNRMKYEIVLLAAGLIAALIAFSLSQYLLSLAILGIMYILLLLLPSPLKRYLKTGYRN